MFIQLKLTITGKRVVVNTDNITCMIENYDRTSIYFNDEDGCTSVEESLDEILELIHKGENADASAEESMSDDEILGLIHEGEDPDAEF